MGHLITDEDAKGREGTVKDFSFHGIPVHSCPEMTPGIVMFVQKTGPWCPYCGEKDER